MYGTDGRCFLIHASSVATKAPTPTARSAPPPPVGAALVLHHPTFAAALTSSAQAVIVDHKRSSFLHRERFSRPGGLASLPFLGRLRREDVYGCSEQTENGNRPQSPLTPVWVRSNGHGQRDRYFEGRGPTSRKLLMSWLAKLFDGRSSESAVWASAFQKLRSCLLAAPLRGNRKRAREGGRSSDM